MNFVFHYRLARRDLEEPAAAAGAMLPDLWRMVDRRVKPARAPLHSESARVAAVLAGIEHHALVDAAFHASATFRDGEHALASRLKTIGAPRLPLFAHITWEMCLDGALLLVESEPLLADVRNGVGRALDDAGDGPPALAVAQLHHTARKGEPLPVGFSERVAELLQTIAHGAWVAGYADGKRVAERVDGTRQRLGFARLADDARAELAYLCTDAIERARDALDPLLTLQIDA